MFNEAQLKAIQTGKLYPLEGFFWLPFATAAIFGCWVGTISGFSFFFGSALVSRITTLQLLLL